MGTSLEDSLIAMRPLEYRSESGNEHPQQPASSTSVHQPLFSLFWTHPNLCQVTGLALSLLTALPRVQRAPLDKRNRRMGQVL